MYAMACCRILFVTANLPYPAVGIWGLFATFGSGYHILNRNRTIIFVQKQ
jgi:hypothetical protein